MPTLVNLSKLPKVLIDFIDTRLMPNAPSYMQFLLGGSTPLLLSRKDIIVEQLKPLGKSLGIVDTTGTNINVDILEEFLKEGFSKANGRVYWSGFIFTPEDGDALIALLKHEEELR